MQQTDITILYSTVTFMGILLRMRNASDKYCREKQDTSFVFNNFFLQIVRFVRQ